jgi:hypothetical protein
MALPHAAEAGGHLLLPTGAVDLGAHRSVGPGSGGSTPRGRLGQPTRRAGAGAPCRRAGRPWPAPVGAR